MNIYVTDRVKEVLEWPAVLEQIERRCRTAAGKRTAAAMAPLSISGIRDRLERITRMKEMRIRDLDPDFSGIGDVEPLLLRAEKQGVLALEELAGIRSFVLASRRMRRFLAAIKGEYRIFEDEYSSLEELRAIGDVLVPAITDAGSLSEAYYPALKTLKDSIHAVKKDIEKSLGDFINSKQGDTVLQEKIFTRRSERYSLLVRANMKAKLPGNVLDASSSGATLYMEPDFVRPRNNELIMKERELHGETLRILADLSALAAEGAPELRQNAAVLAGLDLIAGAASFSEAVRGHGPEVTERPGMRLFSARHPLLTLMNPAAVPNDVELGEHYRCLIISGANTGGKTVLLKTIGLCALMTLHGLHIPASPDSTMGVFTCIMADIGDDQNLAQSLSTFSGQMAVIREMLERADRAALIIIDEIVVGTNPRQGSALARAVLEELTVRESCVVATTHYNELKELASKDARFMNASVSFNTGTLKPEYRLHTGIPGTSYALEIAGNCGIPPAVLARASDLLNESETGADALIERMQKMEEEMREEREAVRMERQALREERERIGLKEQRQRRREEEIKRLEGISFIEEIREHRRGIAERIKRIEEAGVAESWKEYEALRRMEEDVMEEIKDGVGEMFRDRYEPVNPESLAPGKRIFVLPLEREGEIAAVDPERETVTVLLGGNITSRYRYHDLLSPRDRGTPKRKTSEKKTVTEDVRETEGSAVPMTIQTSYNTVDLRGMRVLEGLRKMEDDLDGMTRSGVDSAVIIHGHGTGAMKEAVRSALPGSPYVRDFRAGEQGEGGDGVTIVLLRKG